ncbi:hypothetical protein BKA80DRAFT_253506 [Phyllosticta citrichinensis]
MDEMANKFFPPTPVAVDTATPVGTSSSATAALQQQNLPLAQSLSASRSRRVCTSWSEKSLVTLTSETQLPFGASSSETSNGNCGQSGGAFVCTLRHPASIRVQKTGQPGKTRRKDTDLPPSYGTQGPPLTPLAEAQAKGHSVTQHPNHSYRRSRDANGKPAQSDGGVARYEPELMPGSTQHISASLLRVVHHSQARTTPN